MRNALLVLSALSLTTLFACAPQPASMTLAGSEAVEVHTLDAVALPQVNLLDASGNPIADTSKVTITWAVADAAVAQNAATNTYNPNLWSRFDWAWDGVV